MCWRTYETPIKQIAKEDIPVFKTVNKIGDKLRSVYRRFEYEVGKLYTGNLEDPEEDLILWSCINIAFHSYSGLCKIINYHYLYFDILSPDGIVIDRSQISQCRDLVKVNCIIPKGSTYYVNELDEYVSNRIKIISVENIE